jgi:hypothetical protein
LNAPTEEASDSLFGIEFDPLRVLFFLLLFKGLAMETRGSGPALGTTIAIEFSAGHQRSFSAKSLLNLAVVWHLLLNVVCPRADINGGCVDWGQGSATEVVQHVQVISLEEFGVDLSDWAESCD